MKKLRLKLVASPQVDTNDRLPVHNQNSKLCGNSQLSSNVKTLAHNHMVILECPALSLEVGTDVRLQFTTTL